MTQFLGPVQLANDQWVRSLTRSGVGVPAISPIKSASEISRQQVNLFKMRGALVSSVGRQQWQQKRAELIDSGILKRREEDPDKETLRRQQRAVPRMTISEINRMAMPQIRELLHKSGGNTIGDQRGLGMKFLDLLDMPRDSILRAAVADEIDLEEISYGALVTAGIGAIAGGLLGMLTLGPVGLIAGALKGAASGGIAYGGAMAATSAASAAFLDDEERSEIREISQENERGGFDRPRIWMSDILDGLGMENRLARGILGFMGDVAIDPLTYISGGGNTVKWGTANSRLIAVEHRGAKYLKHAAKNILENGTMVGGKLVINKGSVYKPLEDLVNNSLLLKVSDDVPETLLNLAPGLDRPKRIREALEAVGTTAAMTKKQKKAAVNKIQLAIRDDLIFAKGLTPSAYTNVNILKMGEISRTFFRRFEARADFQIHVPFADIVSPMFYRLTGYKNLGQNIPLKIIPGPRRAQYKALRNTDEAFIAAESAARAARHHEVIANLGRYSGTSLVIGKRTVESISELEGSMPASLRAKVDFTVTESPLSVSEGRMVNKGIRVNVIDLNSNEYKFLKEQGWKLESPSVAHIDDVVDEAALLAALEAKERSGRIDGYSDILGYVNEYASLEPAAAAARQDLATWTKSQNILRKMHMEQQKAGKDLTFTVERMNEMQNNIAASQKELDSLLANQTLDVEQIKSLLTPRTSEILDAADGLQGGVSGVALGMHGGPGYFGKMFRGHNTKGAVINEKINRVFAEKREGTRVIDEQINRLRQSENSHRGKIQELEKQKRQLEQETIALLGNRTEVSEEAMLKAEEMAPLFGLGSAEVEQFGRVLDAIGDAAVVARGGTKAEWMDNWMQVVKGGDTPDGRAVLFQPTIDQKKFRESYILQENNGSALSPRDVKRLKQLGAADDVMDKVGITSRYTSTGIARTVNGYSVGGFVSIGSNINRSQLMQIAHTTALVNGHRAFTTFVPDIKGGNIAYVFTAKNNADEIARAIEEVGFDRNVRIAINDDGSVVMMTDIRKNNLRNQYDKLKEKLNVTAEKTHKSKSGKEVPGIQGKVERFNARGKEFPGAHLQPTPISDVRRRHYIEAETHSRSSGAQRIVDDKGNDYLRAIADGHNLFNETTGTIYRLNQAVRSLGAFAKKDEVWGADEWISAIRNMRPTTREMTSQFGWPYINPHTGKAYSATDDEIKWSGIESWLLMRKSTGKNNITANEIDNYLVVHNRPPKIYSSKTEWKEFVDNNPRSAPIEDYVSLVFANEFMNPHFRSMHYSDTPGYLFHARATIRNYDGKRILQIEEIQSDLYQTARRHVDDITAFLAKRYRIDASKSFGLTKRVLDSRRVPELWKVILRGEGFGDDSGKIMEAIGRVGGYGWMSKNATSANLRTFQISKPPMTGLGLPGGTSVSVWERAAIRRVMKYAAESDPKIDGIAISDGIAMHDKLTSGKENTWLGFISDGVEGRTYEIVKRHGDSAGTRVDALGKYGISDAVEIIVKNNDGSPVLSRGMIDEMISRVKDARTIEVLKDGSLKITQLKKDLNHTGGFLSIYPSEIRHSLIFGKEGDIVNLPTMFNPGLVRAYDTLPDKFRSVSDELGANFIDKTFTTSHGVPLDMSSLYNSDYKLILEANTSTMLQDAKLSRYLDDDIDVPEVPGWPAHSDSQDVIDEVRLMVGTFTSHVFPKSTAGIRGEFARLSISEITKLREKARSLIVYANSDERLAKLGITDEVRELFVRVIAITPEGSTVGRPGMLIPKYLAQRSMQHGDLLWQKASGGTAKASVEFMDSGGAVIRALNEPDLGSVIHEVGHVVRRALSPRMDAKLRKYFRIESESWPVLQEERFAQAFMQFIQDGKAPTVELQEAFEVLGDAMGRLYQKNYDSPIRGSLRKALNAAFGASPDEVRNARIYRQNKSQMNSVGVNLNKRNGRRVDDLSNIEELQTKREMLRSQADTVAEPLRQELKAHNSTFVHRAAEIAERFDRTFRDITGVGRRYTPTGQAVAKLRHGLENTPELEQRLFLQEFDATTEAIATRYGMTNDDAQILIHAKIMEVEMGRGRVGFHRSDMIHDRVREIANKHGGFETVWNDTQLIRRAQKISDDLKKMAIYEASKGALKSVDPRFGYVPLRLTDDAMRQAWAMNAARKEQATVGARGLTTKEGATMHRETNQHWFPVDRGGKYTDDNGQAWDFVWTGELNGSGHINPAYDEYRLARMREKPEKMEAGDIYDYNIKLKQAGAKDEHLIPGGIEEGPRWQVEPTPVSPYQLQEHATDLRHKFGNEFMDAVWETDLGLVLANRVKQHHRIRAVTQFMDDIMPELKVLPAEHVEDLVRNPRQGVTVSSSGTEVIINGVPYRRLNNTIVQSDTVTSILGEKSKNMWYPEELASAIEDYMVKITDDENIKTISKIFDKIQSIWKGTVLLNPAWTTVNILGGIIHSVVVGGLGVSDFINHWGTARRMSNSFHFGGRKGGLLPWGKGILFDDAKKTVVGGELLDDVELAKQLVSINAIDGSQVAREVLTTHRTAFANSNITRTKEGMKHWLKNIATLGPIGSWWFKFNASIDDTFRTAVYLARREKGDSIEAAINTMKRAHFDYGDFTRYEESIGRRLVPFYAWMRNNIGLQFSLLIEKPKYAAVYAKINHAIEESLGSEDKVPNWMLPRWMRNDLITQITGNDGQNKALNIGSLTPIQDLIEIGQGLYGAEGFEEMAHYFLNSTSPMLKIPFELGTGRTVFTGESIGDPELGEKSIREYMMDQIGYIKSYQGIEKAARDGGLQDILMRLAVRGRWQNLDIQKLQMGISIDESEDIKRLRRSINKKVESGDIEAAESIAMRIIERYRIMYLAGIRHRVPKELIPVFNRERSMRRQSGIPDPAEGIPVQRPLR